MKTLLSEEDRNAIAETIRKAEARTSGEIVFAITDASDHYHHAILIGSLLGMTAATGVYLALPVEHAIGMLLWTQLVSCAFFYALLSRLRLQRRLIPGRELDAKVREAALLEFYSSGLYRTRESDGILIYLSVFERRVVVLGDRGIHEKMGDRHWDDVRDKIIQGIKEGKAREGICAAVEICGKALAEHFPHRKDDINELPDQVIDRSSKRDEP